MKQDFYVYAHFDQNGQCRYVGKGRKYRAWMFCQRSIRWKSVFNETKPIVKILESNLTEIFAFERECFYVAEFLKSGCDLTNIACGGPGGNSWDDRALSILSDMRQGKGYWRGIARPDVMAIVKKAQMEKCPKPWFGIKRSEVDPETMEKLQFYGHTKEAIEKRRITMTGRAQSPEHIEARAAGMRGLKRTPEQRAAISAGKLGKPNGLLGHKRSPEFCKKVSESRLKSDIVKMSYKKIWEARRANGTDIGFTTKKARAVICCETGIIYRTAKDAAESIGGSDKHIQACCVGRRATHKGFKWQYVTNNNESSANA